MSKTKLGATKQVRDLIYFDFKKAASIYSQLEGGLVGETQEGLEASTDDKPSRKYKNPMIDTLESEVTIPRQEKMSHIRSKALHHELLNYIENELTALGAHQSATTTFRETSTDIQSARNLCKAAKYLTVSGHSVFEDYRKIKHISQDFNVLSEFIVRSGVEDKTISALEKESRKLSLSHSPDKKRISQLASQRAELLEKYRAAVGLPEVDSWIIDAFHAWIDKFIPDRVVFRVYPNPTLPELQFVSTLKRDCFLDSDIQNVIFAYGDQPNVELSIFGLVTSVPELAKNFDPLAEFESPSHDNKEYLNQLHFEKVFRSMFVATGGIEKFLLYSRFPNITLYPIAVYRSII